MMEAPLISRASVDSVRRKWAPYDKCDECNAIAGNPCRNVNRSGWPGSANVRRTPHPNRQLKDTTE